MLNIYPTTIHINRIRTALAKIFLLYCVCAYRYVDSATNTADGTDTRPPQAIQTPSTLHTRKYAHLWLDYENDANFNSLVDKYYTAGVRLTFVSKESQSRFLHLLSLQRFFNYDTFWTSFGIAIKQEMYAPKDRFSLIPPADDHPYGGYISATLSGFVRSEYMFENLHINLGMVGRASGAKEVQDLIHDLTNNAHLAGWDTQLRNEFILNAQYGISWSIPKILQASARSLDIMPSFSASLGNARIHAQANVLSRFGYHLTPNTAPMHINAGFVGAPNPSGALCIYGFAGVGVRAIGRNIFLQGNTFAPHFASEHSIDMLPIMVEYIWGGAIEYSRFMLIFSVVHRSKEFATQDGFHNFALISIGTKI